MSKIPDLDEDFVQMLVHKQMLPQVSSLMIASLTDEKKFTELCEKNVESELGAVGKAIFLKIQQDLLKMVNEREATEAEIVCAISWLWNSILHKFLGDKRMSDGKPVLEVQVASKTIKESELVALTDEHIEPKGSC